MPEEYQNSEDPFPCKQYNSTFRQTHYQTVSQSDWNTPNWQQENSIDSFDKLKRLFNLTSEELDFFNKVNNFPFIITPYYASLLSGDLRRTVIPSCQEFNTAPCERIDPLNEDHQSPAHNIVHRYPDRVLFLLTSTCLTNCRYCTRSRFVGKDLKERFDYQKGIEYIKQHKEIRDVLFSGGDPLTLDIKQLESILKQVQAIPHVEMMRIGTKTPVVLPQRITPTLVQMLKQFKPLYMSIHFTHPDELTPETSYACNMLADAGIVLRSQTVLLKGINDDSITLKKLFCGLLKIRVSPYYLYHCDLVKGTGHFRTTIEAGLKLMEELQGKISGYAIPKYIVDTPEGKGKVPIFPNNYKRIDGGWELTNYLGEKIVVEES